MSVETYPPRPQSPNDGLPAWSNDSHSGPGKPRANIPLTRYLDRLLDPSIIIRPPESLQPSLVQEPVEPPAPPAPTVSTWQRAKTSATKTLRAAAARRQSRSDGPSPLMVPATKTPPASRPKTKPHTSTQTSGDNRQKIMMALIPVLGVMLVLVIKNPLKVSPTVPVQNTPRAEAATAPVADVEIAWGLPPLYQPGLRDPMKLPEPPVAAVPEVREEPQAAPKRTRVELVVSGILYSPDRPAAIVDTHLVHEGQQISGATVRKIERDSVEFEWNGQTWKQTVDN